MAETGARTGKVQLMRMLSGAVVGAAGAALFLTLAGKSRLDLADPGVALTVIAGLSYALMGLAVGFGAIAPRAGARFLNVEDAEEIREQRRNLGPSAVACIFLGLFLLALAMAPALIAAIGREAVAIVAIGALAAGVLITIVTRKRSDELIRQVSLESSAAAQHVTLVGLGIWAALAELGYVEWTRPLVLIGGLALLHLLTIFGAAAQKGLIRMR